MGIDDYRNMFYTEEDLPTLISKKKGYECQLREARYIMQVFTLETREYQDAKIKRTTAMSQLKALAVIIPAIMRNGSYGKKESIINEGGDNNDKYQRK